MVGNWQMEGADYVHCFVTFYVRDLSICGFVYLGKRGSKTYPPPILRDS